VSLRRKGRKVIEEAERSKKEVVNFWSGICNLGG